MVVDRADALIAAMAMRSVKNLQTPGLMRRLHEDLRPQRAHATQQSATGGTALSVCSVCGRGKGYVRGSWDVWSLRIIHDHSALPEAS